MAKKQTNDQKIISALDAIDKSVRNLRKFGARYDDYMDRAVISGDDARAKKLINQKIRVYALAEMLENLKANIELGAYTAKVASNLGKLPEAIAGCKGLLSESPNFKKVGSDIEKIFKDMEKPAEEISKLNDILDDVLSPKAESSLESRLEISGNYETSEKFQAEWAAMEERVKGKVGQETVSKPAVGVMPTGDIDFDALIAEENKKD